MALALYSGALTWDKDVSLLLRQMPITAVMEPNNTTTVKIEPVFSNVRLRIFGFIVLFIHMNYKTRTYLNGRSIIPINHFLEIFLGLNKRFMQARCILGYYTLVKVNASRDVVAIFEKFRS